MDPLLPLVKKIGRKIEQTFDARVYNKIKAVGRKCS